MDLITLLIILSIPTFFYAYVWTQSKHFISLCKSYDKKSDPVQVFAKLSSYIKLFQFSSFALYVYGLGPLSLSSLLESPIRLLLGLIFFTTGQILNVGIYKAIGVEGVYYGCRLGKTIPWCSGFPFNVVPYHPQYIGSILSIWGLTCFALNDTHHLPLLHVVAPVWTIYYVITAAIEQYC